MEYGGPVSEFLSPESTVTTLLSSSGHLRSSLRPPDLNTTFRYKDKDYDSASAALDAYITDFDRSNLNGSASTGRLVLQHGLPSTLRRHRVSTLRNRDVLMESLTERELDFLDLPVSSLRHAGNRDRLSMTTDELLCIPNDGSMPVTHTSAFIHGLLSRSGSSQPHCSPQSPQHRACAGLSSHINPRLNHQHPQHTRTPRSYRRGQQPATFITPDDIFSESSFKSAHRAAGSEWAEPSSLLHHPHRFTSNKADVERSRMNCVPDLKYGPSVEAWIQGCDFSKGPLPPEAKLRDNAGFVLAGVLPHADPSIRTPAWVAELEGDDSDLCSVVDSQLTLQDLRLQFAEQISLLTQERRSSDMKETLLRDNRIDSLIQKADRVLNSLSQSCDGRDSSARSVSPVNTEELPLRSPSHSSSVSRDSAVAAGGSTDALTETGAQTLGCSAHGNSIQKQPGPVEALKQMLFRLQAMEGKVQAQQHGAQGTPALTNQLHTEKIPAKQRTEGDAEQESFSGGLSLHRALQHVSRLKLLVEEPTEKHREEGKDEGYSSSADRLICTQQKPS